MKNKTIKELVSTYPYVVDFFKELELEIQGCETETLANFLSRHSNFLEEEKSANPSLVLQSLEDYIFAMEDFLGEEEKITLTSLTIQSGFNKQGKKENFEEIVLYPSQVIAIVGPTGSGKSRLLGDIEWTANGDTQTKRKIRINGEAPDPSLRFAVTNKLVAQLSQNMNFVIDATVQEFLEMHAECRNVRNKEKIIEQIIESANDLSGEGFDRNTNVTALSGGQSRALMIADTAILSLSPIVLIDEIENAGIDRKRALDLLLSKEKIVLIATHDPLLCLMADKRLVIKNGGIEKIITTSEHERQTMEKLWEMDHFIADIRQKLRLGEEV